uniref:Glycoprotein endo-alpha-1,2-mannosidase n=1 Tax=Plectus sambesii TaxID=2011161 RepID=A0A914VCP4_9BILA
MNATRCIKYGMISALLGIFVTGFYLSTIGEEKTVPGANPKFEWVAAQREKMRKDTKGGPIVPARDELTAPIGGSRLQLNASERAHIFYYPWYGNPQYDGGKYYHWNHEYLQHWDKNVAERWPKGRHTPPDDIGASFYPQLGAYSSADMSVMRQHMEWIAESGVGVVAVSWYPDGLSDSQGHSWASLIPALLEEADKFGLKIALHVEPYKDRTVATLRADLQFIQEHYGSHRAFYRIQRADGRRLPLIYIYDSYLIEKNEWQTLLKADGAKTIRNTPFDAVLIGLLVKNEDRYMLQESGFDGIYTYFAAERFTYGSITKNWPNLRVFTKRYKMLFIPSVGPGYDDTRVRPWNGENMRGREDGAYYRRQFNAAMDVGADCISITSFNEWHEGTQIEPAVPKTDSDNNFVYKTYNQGPNQYLALTRSLLSEFAPPTSAQ